MKKWFSDDFGSVFFNALIIVSLVALGVMALKMAQLKDENNLLRGQLEAASKEKVSSDSALSHGEAVFATFSERDVVDPGRSGIYDRLGVVEPVELEEELEKLGLSRIATVNVSGAHRLVAYAEDGIAFKFTSEIVPDELGETYLVSAAMFDGEDEVPLMRDQRVTLNQDVFFDGENGLSPTIGYYDDGLKLFVSDRELDCLKWALLNDMPEDAAYVEDCLYSNVKGVA